MGRVAVVTDSTASVTADAVAEFGLRVIPLQVVIGTTAYAEAISDVPVAGTASPELVAESLREHVPVSTSRPAPAVIAQVYRELIAEGYEEIVSVHLSGEMSGTFESAELAAQQVPGAKILAVDSRQVGPATGYAALAAARAVAGGADAAGAASVARSVATTATSLFYVDTLDYLRRGGRIGAAAALLGSALAVKPLLQIEDGRVDTLEKVRTTSKALARLADLAVEAAEGPSEVCVAHLANPERAEALAESLAERLADQLAGRAVRTAQLGAVLGAHVGPGMVAVCVAPRTER